MIKKHNTIVIVMAALVSAVIWICAFGSHPAKKGKVISAKVFEGLNGWGYDILVNDTLFIHQESVPGTTGKKGFYKKEQAEQVTELIINKMKRRQLPSVTTFELDQILSSHEKKYDQPGQP